MFESQLIIRGETMDIKVTTENRQVPVTVLHVDGNIDSSSYEDFQKKAQDIIDRGARHIVVDLSHVPYVSSAGLRALHDIFNQLRKQDPSTMTDEQVRRGISAGTYKSSQLKLVNLSNETKTVFQMSGFDMVIDIYDDMEKALASFQA